MAINRPVSKTTISTVQWGIPITDEVNRLTTAQLAGVPTAWVDLTLINGWLWENPMQRPQYRKVGDTVEIRGTIYHASFPPSNVFQLPAGYVPPANLRLDGVLFKTGVGGTFGWRGMLNTVGQFSVDETSAGNGVGVTLGFNEAFSTT